MKKIAAILLAVCVLGGCSTAQAAPDTDVTSEMEETSSEPGRPQKSGKEKRRGQDTGTVMSLEGNTVTIEKTPSGERKTMPEGSTPGLPDGGKQRAGDAPPDGVKTTVTVLLPDGCNILLEQEAGTTQEGSLEDIAVGARIQMQYGEDGRTVTCVTVLAERAVPPERPKASASTEE